MISVVPSFVFGQLKYGSFFGNVNSEEIAAFDKDENGNIYIVGYYNLSGGNAPYLPTNNKSYQPSFGGGFRDYFVAKLDSTFKLLWCTFVGGQDFDQNIIKIKTTKNSAYVIFSTSDTIYTKNNVLKRKPQAIDLCILKFDTKGNVVISRYFGGENDDYLNDFEVQGNVLYLVGNSNSRTGIGTTPAYCPSYPGLNSSLKTFPYIVKLDTNLNQIYGSYLGKNADFGTGNRATIAIGHDNNYYIGFTVGTDKNYNAGWATPNAHQKSLNGSWDGVLSKFNKINNLEWSTFIGGNSEDIILDVYYKEVDSTICVYGKTSSSYGLIDSARFPKKSSYTDAFLSEFNTVGKRIFCRYLGGNGVDENTSNTQTQRICSIGKDILVVSNTGDWNGRLLSDNLSLNCAFLSNELKGGIDDVLYLIKNTGTIKFSGYIGGENHDYTCGPLYKNGVISLIGHTKSNFGISTKNSEQELLGGDRDLFLQRISIPTYSKLILLDSQSQCLGNNQFRFTHYQDIEDPEFIIKDSISTGIIKNNSWDYAINFKSAGSYRVFHFGKYKNEKIFKLLDSVSVQVTDTPRLNISFKLLFTNEVKDSFSYGDSIGIFASYKSKENESFNSWSYSINNSWLCLSGLGNSENINMMCNTSAKSIGWNKVLLQLIGRTGCNSNTYDSFFVIQKASEVSSIIKSIDIFPNPTDDNIFLKGELNQSNEAFRIEIYDYIGRLLESQLISDITNFSYPIKANLGEGLFIVHFLNGGQTILNKKVIVH